MIGYIFLLFTLFSFAILSKIYSQYRKILAISFSVFFIGFIGLRFDVGVDYMSYKEIFEERYDVAEIGYNFLSDFVYCVSKDYWFLTLSIACLIVTCIHRIFWQYSNFFFSFFLYIIMSGGYAFMVNGTRQALAAGFFLIAMSYIGEKKKYFFFFAISSCFHLSAIALLPFYWIGRKKYPSNFCFYIFLFVFLTSFLFSYGDFFIKVLSFTYYSKYVLMLDVFREIEASSTGLGFLVINLLGLVILYKANSILKLHPELLPFIWAYFFFLVLRNFLVDLPVFLRITIYFDYAMYIIIPYYITLCYKGGSRILVGVLISLLLSTLFIKSISDEMFNLKYKSILFIANC